MWTRVRRIWAAAWAVLSAAACAQEEASAPRAVFDAEGFRVAAPGFQFQFPRDHGSHPDFRIEWWYLTGHFRATTTKRAFGFQATFFRLAQTPGGREGPRDQLLMGHMALIEKGSGRFLHQERLRPAGWDAWSRVGDLDARIGNWTLRRDASLGHNEAMRLTGSVLADARWSFEFVPQKPRTIFGRDGVSRKGASAAAASHYITFPRLRLTGRLDWDGRSLPVEGEAWMDHEISSSQLDRDQAGWDWASVQLDDGREIMMYLLRTQSGDVDPWSRLYWIDRDGTLTPQASDRFAWSPGGAWISPHTGATYPMGGRLETIDPKSGRRIAIRLAPEAKDQEIVGKIGGVNYWEGACRAFDGADRPVGRAYLELTGYDGSLADRLRARAPRDASIRPSSGAKR